MDIASYIASGILENYVFGNVSSQEQQEVECLSRIYPEIKEELNRLQFSIEQMAVAAAIKPPEGLKAKILEAIEREGQNDQSKTDQQRQTTGENTNQPETSPISDAKILPLFWKVAAAASVCFAIGMFALWYQTNQQIGFVQNDASALKKVNDSLLTQMTALNERINQEVSISSLLAHANTREVNLPGLEVSPTSNVKIYWNTNTKEVLLKVDQLPDAPLDKQYQLWAIENGQPVSLGVFDLNASKQAIQKMSLKAENAQAFAITLEKSGGSPTPTMEAMYVMGKV